MQILHTPSGTSQVSQPSFTLSVRSRISLSMTSPSISLAAVTLISSCLSIRSLLAGFPKSIHVNCFVIIRLTSRLAHTAGPTQSVYCIMAYFLARSGYFAGIRPFACPVGKCASSSIQIFIPLFFASSSTISKSRHQPGPPKSGWGRRCV